MEVFASRCSTSGVPLAFAACRVTMVHSVPDGVRNTSAPSGAHSGRLYAVSLTGPKVLRVHDRASMS